MAIGKLRLQGSLRYLKPESWSVVFSHLATIAEGIHFDNNGFITVGADNTPVKCAVLGRKSARQVFVPLVQAKHL